MDALVTELDLQKVIVTNENWTERNSEINRLSGLQDYVVKEFNEARSLCKDIMSLIRPDPSGPVSTLQDTVDDLNEAEAQLKSVYYSLFKPYYEKLKILHGERASSSGDRATNKKINEALESNKEAFLRTRQKVAEIKVAVKAKQDEETSVASDLRHKLVDKQIDKQRVKAVSELKPQTLTRSFLPDRMREWKYDFEQWYDSSNFGSLKPSGQVSYFSQAIDPEVKTHLWQLKPKITLDQVKGDKVFLFPNQAKEAGVAEAHSLWNRLDLL